MRRKSPGGHRNTCPHARPAWHLAILFLNIHREIGTDGHSVHEDLSPGNRGLRSDVLQVDEQTKPSRAICAMCNLEAKFGLPVFRYLWFHLQGWWTRWVWSSVGNVEYCCLWICVCCRVIICCIAVASRKWRARDFRLSELRVLESCLSFRIFWFVV